jgi:hypothetical protein
MIGAYIAILWNKITLKRANQKKGKGKKSKNKKKGRG